MMPKERRVSVSVVCSVWLAGLVLTGSAWATDHAGTCTGTFAAADNPHRLTGTCTVPAGQTLTIQSGVTLNGQHNIIIVNGTLNANGITLTDVYLVYHSGSGGTLQNSSITTSGATSDYDATLGHRYTSAVLVAGTSTSNRAAPTLMGNTIQTAYGGNSYPTIAVAGTAQPTVSGNTVTTNGTALQYDDSGAGTASGNTIGFVEASSSSRRGLVVNGGAGPSVTNNTIANDTTRTDVAIDLSQVASTCTATVTGNQVCVTGADESFQIGLGAFRATGLTVSGNTFPCETGAGVTLTAGTTTGNTTVAAINGLNAYRLDGAWTVATGHTLTVSSGLTLTGNGAQTITAKGTLNANAVTLTDVYLIYHSGSGGTLQNSSLTTGSVVYDYDPVLGYRYTSAVLVTGTSTTSRAAPMLTGNTLRSTYSGGATYATVAVAGTGQPTVTGNGITTNGVALRFDDTAGGTASGNTLAFVEAAGSSRRGLVLSGAVGASVTNNTIANDTTRVDVGIDLSQVASACTATVTGNSVCATGNDEPLQLGPEVFRATGLTVSGNTFPCEAGAGVTLAGGTTLGSTTLAPINGLSAYRLDGAWTVAAGHTLTLPAGVTLTGNGAPTITVKGTLNANGATLTDVYLIYHSGSGGTVQNSSLTTSSVVYDYDPVLGYRYTSAVLVTGTSTTSRAAPMLTGNTLRSTYSGGATYATVAVAGTGQPTVTGNGITTNGVALRFDDTAGGTASGNTLAFVEAAGSNRRGLVVSGAVGASVTNNTIANDTTRVDVGIDLSQVASACTATVTGNSVCVTGNDEPLQLGPEVFRAAGLTVSGNTFPCEAGAGVTLAGGTTLGNTTLAPINGLSAYRLDGAWTVAAGHTLTLPAGITLTGNGAQTITVKGTLNANAVTLTDVYLVYHSGSAGTLQNSSLTTSSVISDYDTTLGYRHSSAVLVTGALTMSRAAPVLTGNTLRSTYPGGATYATVAVAGTGQPTIMGNTITTNGVALRFEDTAGGTATGNILGFVAAGGSGRSALVVSQNSSATINGNTITDDPEHSDTAIDLGTVGAACTASITSNSVCTTGADVPLELGLDAFRVSGLTISGNMFPCGQGAGTTLATGTTTGNVTIRPLNGQSTYRLGGPWTVASGHTLTLETGLTLAGQSSPLLTVNGTLVAEGVALTNVYIAFGPGSHGVVRDSTLTTTSYAYLFDPGPNAYRYFTGILVLDHAAANRANPVIEDNAITATFGSTGYPAIFVVGTASPTITGNILEGFGTGLAFDTETFALAFSDNVFRSFQVGVEMQGASTATSDLNLFDSNTVGLRISDGRSRTTLVGNTFQRNRVAVGFHDATALFSGFPSGLGSSSFIGTPDKNTLALPTSFEASGTLPVAPVAYSSTGFSLPTSRNLILQPGTVLQMSTQALITADGQLIALGTADAPIVFTAQAAKNGTRWRGLVINNKPAGTQTELASCVFEYAGVFAEPALRLANASVDVSDSRFSNNNAAAIEVSGSSQPQITGSVIVDNGGVGIAVDATARPVAHANSIFANGGLGMSRASCPTTGSVASLMLAADTNYWGDDTGPRDASDDQARGGLHNPSALGDDVSNCIDYDPWVRLGPSIEGTISAVGGTGQTAPVGSCLAAPLVVEVRSTLGNPIEGIDVTFSVSEGDGTIEEEQPLRTNAAGRAGVTVCLGMTPGDVSVVATARDVNSPLAIFAATGAGVGGGALHLAVRAVPVELDVKRHRRGQPGDVNLDGRVNNADAALILGVLAGRLSPDVAPATAFSATGDINGDHRITAGDASAIQGYVVGAIPGRPARAK